MASSYAAFLAPLGHIAARLHAIGNQARRARRTAGPTGRMILVCAHAGLKTGEDGPTHADPQALQLLQENFPPGTAITLTPWDPAEIVAAGLGRARAAAGGDRAVRHAAQRDGARPREAGPGARRRRPRTGVYRLRAPKGAADGTLVLQESAVTLAFVADVLPRLEREGVDLDVYYVASAELFDALPPAERERIFPEARAREAMGITGFTLATMYRWVPLRPRPGGDAAPVPQGPLPGQRPGRGGAGTRPGSARPRSCSLGQPPTVSDAMARRQLTACRRPAGGAVLARF